MRADSHIYLLFSEGLRREGKGFGWALDEPDVIPELITALRTQALPFLRDRASLNDFLAMTPLSKNRRTLQAIGYSLARVGRIDESIETLDQLLARGPDERAWEIALADQVRAFRAKLIHVPVEAQRQLIAWEAETTQNIGLTKFRQQ